VQPLALALATGATCVARGFFGEQKHLTRLVAGAIAHRGFALVDVFSPCVTFKGKHLFLVRPTYEDSEPVFRDGPLVSQPLGLEERTCRELQNETT
jgi:hypothetical protein